MMIQVKFSNDNSGSTILKEYSINLYREQTLTDCVIYCRDSRPDAFRNKTANATATNNLSNSNNSNRMVYKEFHCHRLVLCAYSDFFQKHFHSLTDVHHIYIDLDAQTLGNIIELIYNGSVTIANATEEENLFNAAFSLGLKHISSNNGGGNQYFRSAAQLMSSLQSSPFSHFPQQSSSIIGTNEYAGNHLKKRLQSATITGTGIQEDSNNNRQQLNKRFHPESDSSEVILNQSTKDSFGISAAAAGGGENDDDNFISKMVLNKIMQMNQRQQLDPPLQDNVDQQNSASDSIVQEPSFTCPYCQKQYTYEISLKKHIKSHHPNN